MAGHAEACGGATRVLGRHIEDVFDAFDALGTEPLAGGTETAVRDPDASGDGIPHFDLDVRTRSGARLWVNISMIVFDNRRTGRRLLVQLARDIAQSRINAMLFDRMREVARQIVALTEDASQLAPVEGLTKHELRILALFARGGTSASIATSWTFPLRHCATTSTASTASSARTAVLQQ